ncbi:Peptidase A1 domain-containing protein [Caenorhabditis elegans]|uniref:Peptidase A1 domain-containing protein n=1 Tax=Caenorhabditis elegans TaxID=6239 RepID=Q94271_CAEEL|nr:Peptidase A1 domain-containing protein [Caenorhabditis elegans]CCD72625.2 Peptidase A1 domain-containing protein [Caenorhabditis elegans]|eukprot:NP_509082.2 ASpartyl Protease [Caenorhabditis elegans]
MIKTILLLAFVASTSAFVIPFKVHAAVTNITKGGQTLEQTSTFFVANLTMGTPGQLFTVVIDTSTADIVIPDMSCKTANNCYNKRRFNQAKSSSYYAYGNKYTYKNNLGTFQGFDAKDTVVIGDRKTDLITIPGVKFMQATDLGLLMDGLGADGILGLGFTASSQIGGNSPFVQGVNAGDISGTFYSIWLEHFNQTDDLGTHGVIYYGGFDPVHCAPNPTYVPLASAYAYQLTMSSFKVVGSSATNSNNKYIQTYLDTTTAQIGLPKTYISQVFDSLGISTNVMNAIYPTIVPCNTKITLTFGFVSGTTVSITERDLVISFFGTCRLQIIPTTDRIILGLPLYRGRCTYFDPIMQRVGFTPALLQD